MRGRGGHSGWKPDERRGWLRLRAGCVDVGRDEKMLVCRDAASTSAGCNRSPSSLLSLDPARRGIPEVVLAGSAAWHGVEAEVNPRTLAGSTQCAVRRQAPSRTLCGTLGRARHASECSSQLAVEAVTKHEAQSRHAPPQPTLLIVTPVSSLTPRIIHHPPVLPVLDLATPLARSFLLSRSSYRWMLPPPSLISLCLHHRLSAP